jgi:CRISPR/Cas system CSM-associated protein Csm2 small subunit
MSAIPSEARMAEAGISYDSDLCATVVFCDGLSAIVSEYDWLHLPGVAVAIDAIQQQEALLQLLEFDLRGAELNLDRQQFEVDEINGALSALDTNVLVLASADVTEVAETDRKYQMALEIFENQCRALIQLMRAHKRCNALDEECVSRADELQALLAKAKRLKRKLKKRTRQHDEALQEVLGELLKTFDSITDLQNRVDMFELFTDWLNESGRLTTKSMPSRVLDLDNAWAQFIGETGAVDARGDDSSLGG